ncbi:MAG: hypothetical protein J7604_12725 [Sporocytophaga sp.]|uniref:hypothetical protein n=1 Tax=Sporocytophaga sp. TaxID=2231183 RepID=UPI001B049EED|nr:hypothetical protein [Sporocytophaga sp.]MBO9701067.1 hypothetical protein [Sporocytophaga sp.]
MTVIRYISLLLFFISPMIVNGQTFANTSTVTIPASNTNLTFLSNSINVTGLSNIDGTPFGLEQVEIAFKTSQFTKLELFLVSPNGRIVSLINGISGSSSLTGTITLNMNPSNQEIRFWTATTTPPATPFLPMASLNSVNDGSSPNGSWRLLAGINNFIAVSNQITSWSLTFGTNNTTPTPSNDDCSGAIDLINTAISGAYVSGTNKGYGSTLPSQGDIWGSSVCGSGYTENTAWFTWVASCANDSINIQSFTRVQTGILKGSCGGSLTSVGCKTIDNPNNYTYKFTNLTPGSRYFLAMDGDKAYYGPFDIRWYPGNCTPLPVSLLNFKASYDTQTGDINLQWKTVTEQNNKEFIIKAKNHNKASGFIEIARVKSYSQNTGSNYEINWTPEHDGFYEFQLFQTDVDGTTTYLNHTFSSVNSANAGLSKISYTESGPQLNIELGYSDLLNLSIIDLSGKIIWSETKQVDAGTSLLPLPSDIAQALYILEVRTYDRIERRKLLYK